MPYILRLDCRERPTGEFVAVLTASFDPDPRTKLGLPSVYANVTSGPSGRHPVPRKLPLQQRDANLRSVSQCCSF